MQIYTAIGFWILAIATLVVGWRYNRGLERALVAAIGISVAATMGSGLLLDHPDASLAVLVVDIALVFVAIPIALYGTRHWPLWFAAFALVGALTGIASRWVDAEYWLFRMLAGFWAIPALLAVLVGSLRDARAERGDSSRSAVTQLSDS